MLSSIKRFSPPPISILIMAFSVLAFSLSSCSARPTSAVVGVAGMEGVGVEIWASNKCPQIDETVTVHATVTNRSSSQLVAELKDQPVLDLLVGEARWSEGKPLTSDMTRFELDPGQSKSIEMQYVVKKSYFGVSARFIPNARYIEYPVSPYMVIGGCSGLIGP